MLLPENEKTGKARQHIGKASAVLAGLVMSIALGSIPAVADANGQVHGFSIVDMVVIQGETVIADANGASTLRRDPKGANATIHIADLQAGVAYSVWALAFNRPRRCQAVPCLPGPDGQNADLSIFWVAGGIAAQGTGGGVLNLSFRIDRRRPADFVVPSFGQHGLTNVKGAEVHFVLVEHQEAMPGFMAGPMTTPGPGVRAAVHMAP